jgi:hypothetical protein
MLPAWFSGADQELLLILACLVFQVDQFHQVLPFIDLFISVLGYFIGIG